MITITADKMSTIIISLFSIIFQKLTKLKFHLSLSQVSNFLPIGHWYIPKLKFDSLRSPLDSTIPPRSFRKYSETFSRNNSRKGRFLRGSKFLCEVRMPRFVSSFLSLTLLFSPFLPRSFNVASPLPRQQWKTPVEISFNEAA